MNRTSLSGLLLLSLFCLLTCSLGSEAQEPGRTPVVVSVRVIKGALVYRVDRKIVENTRENSLLTNLEAISSTRGLDYPIVILVDVDAPLREVDKLETAIAKIDFTHHTLFVGDFQRGTMEELHWSGVSAPIPASAR